MKHNHPFTHHGPHSRGLALVALVLVALVAAVTAPPQAIAGPADGWMSISATLYDLEPGMTPTLVISGLLPQDTQLPAQAALAIPKGATVSWAGELTGDSANDPTLDITIESHETYDLALFTLTQSPAAQLELAAPEGVVTETDAGLTLAVSWVSGGTAERARVAIATPFAYHLEDVAPEPTVEVRESDVLYWAETVPVTAGQELTLSALFAPGAAPELTDPAGEQTATAAATATAEPISAPAESGTAGLDATRIIVGSLLAIIAVILVVLVRKIREQGRAS